MNIEFQKQFTGARTQGGDCGMVAVIHAMHFATDNELSPTTTELREKAGIPDRKNSAGKVTFATLPDPDWLDAWNAMRGRAEKLGWKLHAMHVYKNAPWSQLIGDLKTECGILLAVNYGTYNDLLPKKSGDVDFDGMHAIFVSPDRASKDAVCVYDGLCDGRTDWPSGVKAPKGPQIVDADKLRVCAEKYTSGSGVTYAVVGRASRIVREGPVDVHVECKKQLTACTVERKNLYDELRACKAEREAALHRAGELVNELAKINEYNALYKKRCDEWARYADKLKAAIDGVPRP